MSLPLASPGVQDAPSLEPVAGRIAAAPSPLREAIDAYLDNLRTRGKKRGTIRVYRTLIDMAIDENQWASLEDFTYESLAGWMSAKRDAGNWRGTTWNRNLSTFRSLAEFLVKTKRISDNPVTPMDRMEDDSGSGARAATLDEARRMVRYAWTRQLVDRRTKGNRALVWQCLFSMGLRAGEPERFLWSHLILDEETPCVHWTKDISKNRKECDTAICPETAALLRAHRETVPHAMTEPVFPTLPPRQTFTADRDGAMILARDQRGRGFSTHSGRKFFSTFLTNAGIHPRIIDVLMRHSGGVQARYADISISEQATALKVLPALWPENHEFGVIKPLDTLTQISDTRGASPKVNRMQSTSANPIQPPRRDTWPSDSQFECASSASADVLRRGGSVGSDGSFQDGNGQGRTELGRTEPTAARLQVIQTALDVAHTALRMLGDASRDGGAA